MSRLLAALALGGALAACSSFDNLSHGIAGVITPYKVEIVQGNFVSKEQVDALQPGMSRQQVRDLLGTPLVTSVFHGDRWDYVFTIKRQGVEPQQRRLTVFFKGEALERFEGDPMPSESEFVATLDNKRKGAKVPVLEATEEQLKAFNRGTPAAPAAAASAPAPAAPPTANYPPLEPPAR
jgi:outer membrane protein assembly factor BamE